MTDGEDSGGSHMGRIAEGPVSLLAFSGHLCLGGQPQPAQASQWMPQCVCSQQQHTLADCHATASVSASERPWQATMTGREPNALNKVHFYLSF